MSSVLDDDDDIVIRDEDKTRQLVLPVREQVIDDLSGTPDTVASALPSPAIAPFSLGALPQLAPPRAPPPKAPARAPSPGIPPRGERADSTPMPLPTSPAEPATAEPGTHGEPAQSLPTPAAPAAASIAGAVTPQAIPRVSSAGAPPPVPGSAAALAAADDAAPTIVVRAETHQPTPKPMRREATVVMRRMPERKPSGRPKQNLLTYAVLGAAVVLGSAVAFVGYRQYAEEQAREAQIRARMEMLREQR